MSMRLFRHRTQRQNRVLPLDLGISPLVPALQQSHSINALDMGSQQALWITPVRIPQAAQQKKRAEDILQQLCN